MKARFIRHVASTVGISILQQFVGLGRQILIAAFFGLSRDFDGYLLVYAVANIVVFNITGVFDTVAVPRLVQIRERDGDAAFWRSSNKLLLQSLAGGLLFAVTLVLALHLALPIVAAGFADADRARVTGLVRYFVPWVVIIVPYYAVSAHLRALWQFHWVFGAEILTMLVSIAALCLWHTSVASLPIAYAAGYACAFVLLLIRRGFSRPATESAPVGVLPGMANQYLANQLGSAIGVVDRYFQSFLAAGGISALGYSGQIVNNLSSLMTFRDIYVVPLASAAGRREKLERILKGVMLISVPSAGFVATFAGPIVQVLFQRGHFTIEAAALTGDVLRILALSLAISSLLAPMARLFQILNRISYSHLLNIVSLAGTAAFQYVLVFRFHWDVYGVAWASVGNSAVVTLVVAELVRRCGIAIRWHHVLGYGLFAAVAAAAAAWLATLATAASAALLAHFDLAALALGGAVYAIVVAAAYFGIRQRLRTIAGIA
jgi:putative peptidoglycan lipid II flippase